MTSLLVQTWFLFAASLSCKETVTQSFTHLPRAAPVLASEDDIEGMDARTLRLVNEDMSSFSKLELDLEFGEWLIRAFFSSRQMMAYIDLHPRVLGHSEAQQGKLVSHERRHAENVARSAHVLQGSIRLIENKNSRALYNDFISLDEVEARAHTLGAFLLENGTRLDARTFFDEAVKDLILEDTPLALQLFQRLSALREEAQKSFARGMRPEFKPHPENQRIWGRLFIREPIGQGVALREDTPEAYFDSFDEVLRRYHPYQIFYSSLDQLMKFASDPKIKLEYRVSSIRRPQSFLTEDRAHLTALREGNLDSNLATGFERKVNSLLSNFKQ